MMSKRTFTDPKWLRVVRVSGILRWLYLPYHHQPVEAHEPRVLDSYGTLRYATTVVPYNHTLYFIHHLATMTHSKFFITYIDRTVKVYNIGENNYEICATLQGHQGPVWQVAWAHAKFGTILASCSFDGSVMIHREVRPREWTCLYHAAGLHKSSVNSCAFGPHEGGLVLAAASADGTVSILQHQPNQTWTVDYLQDSPLGVNAVSWAPFGAFLDPDDPSQSGPPRLVTGSCDHTIKFWVGPQEPGGEWKPDTSMQCDTSTLSHTDWVRDVAWAPSLLPNHNQIASCSEDGQVLVWELEPESSVWRPTLVHKFDGPVWRVSWSLTGYMLAVSSGDGDVSLWKAAMDGTWMKMNTETTVPAAEAPNAAMG